MSALSSFDIRIAKILVRMLNLYIDKRTHSIALNTNEEIWEALYKENDFFVHDLTPDLKIILNKRSLLCKQIYFGYETNEITFIKRFLKENDVFFDIGANIGLYSLHASKLVGDKGKIYAFEPTPKTFLKLKENLIINNIENVEPINLGLSNTRSIINLHIADEEYDAWNSFAVMEDIEIINIIQAEVDTIDSFCLEKRIDNIDLIKIDVEGWEKFVLKGAVCVLKNNKSPVFIIEFTEQNTHAAGYNPQEIFDFMKDYGFEWYSYHADKNSLLKENKKLHYPYQNLIAIKDFDECMIRISEVC